MSSVGTVRAWSMRGAFECSMTESDPCREAWVCCFAIFRMSALPILSNGSACLIAGQKSRPYGRYKSVRYSLPVEDNSCLTSDMSVNIGIFERMSFVTLSGQVVAISAATIAPMEWPTRVMSFVASRDLRQAYTAFACFSTAYAVISFGFGDRPKPSRSIVITV